ncbi:hypothetical protein DAMA08_011440 [Martiniozyma asiatica (nom. inval.)]|nr:hypothetical protein DAMA08_011440 [Martiniozyma asiatica]
MTQPRKPQHSKSELPNSSKPATLYQRYLLLPFKVKLFIWSTTAVVAYLTDSVSDRIFEQNMIDAEAERRVELELKRLQEDQKQQHR